MTPRPEECKRDFWRDRYDAAVKLSYSLESQLTAVRAQLQDCAKERDEARGLLSWAQGCVVRAAHGLALALKGDGIDGANLRDSATGVATGLMEVDAHITAGKPPTLARAEGPTVKEGT